MHRAALRGLGRCVVVVTTAQAARTQLNNDYKEIKQETAEKTNYAVKNGTILTPQEINALELKIENQVKGKYPNVLAYEGALDFGRNVGEFMSNFSPFNNGV